MEANQISSTSSELVSSSSNQAFMGTVAIKNVSGKTIAGPFQVVLASLTSGVTLRNATGLAGGFPYVAVPALARLRPGQLASIKVEFSSPKGKTINFIPLIYSGSFD